MKELILPKEHAFTHGDNKVNPCKFNIDEVDQHCSFMKFNDKLNLLPLNDTESKPDNKEDINDETHWSNNNDDSNGCRNNNYHRKNQYQKHCRN